AISDYKATTSTAPNFAYDLCHQKITAEQKEALDLSHWDVACNGAEPIRADTIDRFTEAFADCGFRRQAFYPCYGLAEATLLVTGGQKENKPEPYNVSKTALAQNRVIDAAGTDSQRLVSSGQSWLDQKVVIVNPDSLAACKEKEVGEIWVSGRSVAQGYWQQPEETAKTFQAHLQTGEGPFLRTGDLGFLKDHQLYVTGRIKDLIIIRGQNHYPQDIERTVEASHPALQPAGGAAFSIEVEGQEQLVVAHEIQRTYLRKIDPAELCTHIRRAVSEAHQLQIHAIALLKPTAIPKTSSGKTQRYLCRQQFLNNELKFIHLDQFKQPVSSQPESTATTGAAIEIQQWLVTWLANHLKVPTTTINPDAAFADYGLDSVAAVEMGQALSDWLKAPPRALDATIAWNYPTISALAHYVADEFDQLDLQEESVHTVNEPIAIIGMGCRLPGGVQTPDEFWQLLVNGVETVTDIPTDRWDVSAYYDPTPDTPGKMYTRQGAFLKQVDQFDPQFFGISPREAVGMDPQQRLLLEVSWEALEQAGQAPERLQRTPTGVFIGLGSDDYAHLNLNQTEPDPYSSLGNNRGVAAGRIAYVLGLQGPAMQVDTTCSSSLLAIHLAAESLKSGQCNLALAGGVSLMLSPETTVGLCSLKALAPDGRSKPFASNADGYGRGEGCGVVILKRLSEAERDNDNILAIIQGSAVNHDGQSNGLTAPNGTAQTTLLKTALHQAQTTANQLQYIETHGTGTVLGDPIEVMAINNVVNQHQNRETPLLIGTVKSNIGHLEAAAGVAGLMKVVLALQHRQIPPNLHFNEPNPHIPWDEIPIRVPTTVTPWSVAKKRQAGVSSFGMSGTNVHVIISEAPQNRSDHQQGLPDQAHRPTHLLALSANSDAGLKRLSKQYAQYLARSSNQPLGNLCFMINAGRPHLDYRLTVVAQSSTELQQKLQDPDEWRQGKIQPSRHPNIAFLFTGQGGQSINMGRDLYENQPIFRQALTDCTAIIDPALNINLLDTMYPTDPSNIEQSAEALNKAQYTQPALFAVAYALAQLWDSWGVKPAVVMGHSLGELVAACVAGIFDLSDALTLVIARARLMRRLPQNGAMVAVMADEALVKEAIAPYADTVSIAAINGPQHIVISGETKAIDTIVQQLQTEQIKTKSLTVSHAFHSPLMEPILTEFAEIADTINYKRPHTKIVSTITGALVSDEMSQPVYWINQIRQAVQFTNGMEALKEEGVDTFIEIGPTPTLLALGQQYLSEARYQWLPTLRPSQNDSVQILDSLGQLYVKGINIDWRAVGTTSGVQADKQSGSDLSKNRLIDTLSNSQVREAWAEWLESVRWEPHPQFEPLPHYPDLSKQLPQQLEVRFNALSAQFNLSHYQAMAQQIEQVCLDYSLQALTTLGVMFKPGIYLTETDVMQQLGIVAHYRPLLQRMLQILAEANILQMTADATWQVYQTPIYNNPKQQIAKIRADSGLMVTAELTLLERCGDNLSRVLQGHQHPLELLFPDGDLTVVTELYQRSIVAQTMNTLIKQVVLARFEPLSPTQRLRILEIGAGTGGTTAWLLPHLPAAQANYVFTD
ncbi:MAG: beta-ketoacyl synthase N-terminal-like domain-containing protein, partial [Chloroflexota bacterium]